MARRHLVYPVTLDAEHAAVKPFDDTHGIGKLALHEPRLGQSRLADKVLVGLRIGTAEPAVADDDFGEGVAGGILEAVLHSVAIFGMNVIEADFFVQIGIAGLGFDAHQASRSENQLAGLVLVRRKAVFLGNHPPIAFPDQRKRLAGADAHHRRNVVDIVQQRRKQRLAGACDIVPVLAHDHRRDGDHHSQQYQYE